MWILTQKTNLDNFVTQIYKGDVKKTIMKFIQKHMHLLKGLLLIRLKSEIFISEQIKDVVWNEDGFG